MMAEQFQTAGKRAHGPALPFVVRAARMDDVRAIYALLQFFAGRNLLLGRSLSSLYDHLRDFKVAVAADNDRQVLGVCSLHICWENLAEIRSLAVAESFQQGGVGRALVLACLDEARNFGISRVFTLTYQPEFFKKINFRPIDKNELPHKVWSDCINCPMFPDCNEESLIWEAGE
ncbi:N-acetyltransferase [Desulfurivibrio alkaliphilus]|uniref:GCN5-related N-acetyltransferase n=1 Tax=Desulfurivibrio alkaliphilus (strain DSM 19089 / UNIQEM U267 / AHT2) TaxID=589865 RepID=D6Z481_DESAT|nr:N-acetyltransferase [Desulfurivibrio alkaliphilus]ADH86356.1 GCN5-related N-acetyltransferase [Desulfurivibrio alkaliphilus AHT 2]